MRIVAIITARNAERNIERCIRSLRDNGVEAFVVDNGSTDKTAQIAASLIGNGVCGIEHLDYHGYLDLAAQLRMRESLARDIDADWIIHHEADEVMEPPAPWVRLDVAITEVDAMGYNAINFDEFVFVPLEGENFSHGDYVARMQKYYFFEPSKKRLVRAWKRSLSASNIADSGGHPAVLESRQIFPKNFCLRHYIGLSIGHLKSRYLGRVFAREDLMKGWHNNQVANTLGFIRPPPQEKLHDLSLDGWRTDVPQKEHLIFDQPSRYLPPSAVTTINERPPMPFVVGVGRSGTTLLRLLLDAHPDLAMTPETGWLGAALEVWRAESHEPLRSALIGAPNWPDMEIGEVELDEVISNQVPQERLRALYMAYAARFNVRRVGDKTPLHGGRMVKILEALPEARFIHIIRDGRDVAVSHRELWFGPGRDAGNAAAFWMWHLREIRQQAQFVPHYLEVRFEDLVTNTESVLRQIGEFIELPFHPNQLKSHERAEDRLKELKDVQWPGRLITREQRLKLFELTKRPPDRSRIGVWHREMPKNDQQQFQEIAGDFLRDLGYGLNGDEEERPILSLDSLEDWRRFFGSTKISIGVEMAEPWTTAKTDVAGYISTFIRELLLALARLGARITPRDSTIRTDDHPRELHDDGFLFAHHSYGHGKGIARFKHGYAPGTFTLDPMGYSGFASIVQSGSIMDEVAKVPPAIALTYATSLRNQYLRNNTSKYRQPTHSGRPPDPGYIFLALQMPRDTVLSLARANPIDFYTEVLEQSLQLQRRIVVKRHPLCRDEAIEIMLEEYASREGVTVSNLSINELLPGAERTVVINSGVGFESLIHGRPTLTFGACEYAIATTQIAKLDEIAKALSEPAKFETVLVAQFLYYFLEKYCVASNDHVRILEKVQECLKDLPLEHGWIVKQRENSASNSY